MSAKATSSFYISGRRYDIGDAIEGADGVVALANGWANAALAPVEPIEPKIKVKPAVWKAE